MNGKTYSKNVQEVIEKKYFSGKVCKKCKKVNPKGASHCRNCGYSTVEGSGKWWREKNKEGGKE